MGGHRGTSWGRKGTTVAEQAAKPSRQTQRRSEVCTQGAPRGPGGAKEQRREGVGRRLRCQQSPRGLPEAGAVRRTNRVLVPTAWCLGLSD